MRESLRVRLVLWYALVLTLVVGLSGAAVCYQSWRSMTSGVDTELRAHALDLANALRPVDGGRFDLELTPAALAYFRGEGPRRYYLIRSRDGELVDSSEPNLQSPSDAAGGREVLVPAPAGATVLVGRDIADLRATERSLILNVVLVGLATLGLSIVGGWFVAGRALAPIEKISRTARAMSAGDLDARISVQRTDSELEQVASTLNDAFDRLRLAVEQERRFTADASHELRTPISVLRAEADWALDRERAPQQYKDSLVVCRRAALRMQDAVERLLALARAEAVAPVQATVPVAIRSLVDDVVAWLAPMAQERQVQIAVDGEAVGVKGDPGQLREALNNVVANAILYNKPGGCVTVSIRSLGEDARIEIVDTGIGIPADAVPHVFDRFFRIDQARSRDQGGSGLGLSIARAIVAAHHGEIMCTSEPGTGSVFVITLPRDCSAQMAAYC